MERFHRSRGNLVSRITIALELSTLSALLKSFRENSPASLAEWFSTRNSDFWWIMEEKGSMDNFLVTFLGIKFGKFNTVKGLKMIVISLLNFKY